MQPKNLLISDFTYTLPENRIAAYPLSVRDQSKLLIYQNSTIDSDHYYNLPDHLPENAVLVFNNTKVVEARMVFQKSSGSMIEIFYLEPAETYEDISIAMLQKEKIVCKCLVGAAKKWKNEFLIKEIITAAGIIHLSAKKIEKSNDYFLIEFSWNDQQISFAEILHLAGEIPLPPYLNRDAKEDDKATYQTIYAKYDGSVAAPTAGLHFTESVLEKLRYKNILQTFVTLHVGAGTFKPVKTETIAAHTMHAEFIDVTYSFIENLLKQLSHPIIAVGTTSLRTVESLYWMGEKLHRKPITNLSTISIEEIAVQQWDPYETDSELISATASLQLLLQWMKATNRERIITKTQILIAPGYPFKIIKALITNFHQPQSTLLLLVAALIGDDWKKVYQHALENNFRFLSYGDGSLLWKKD
jgi:S-adenosylmethionine:tRNA ribosyltransferase-isomerase